MRPLLLLLLAALAAPALAQPVPTGGARAAVRTADVVDWRVQGDRVRPGGEARVVLTATIAPGWRLYALDSPVGRPFRLALDRLPVGVAAGALRQSAPEEGFDEGFGEEYTYFAGEARFVQPLRVGNAAAPGARTVTGTAHYAVCDDRVCLPPARTSFRVSVVVEGR